MNVRQLEFCTSLFNVTVSPSQTCRLSYLHATGIFDRCMCRAGTRGLREHDVPGAPRRVRRRCLLRAVIAHGQSPACREVRAVRGYAVQQAAAS